MANLNKLQDYSGPLYTDSYIEGDSAHFEISGGSDSEKILWVKDYAEGLREYTGRYFDLARNLIESDDPAGAVIASRIALEVPSRSSEFVFQSDIVISAMGVPRLPSGKEKEQHPLGYWFTRASLASDEAFAVPEEIQREAGKISAAGRLAIRGEELDHWRRAINTLSEADGMHATGLAFAELGNAYMAKDQESRPLYEYNTARGILNHALEHVMEKPEPAKHAAEVDGICCHIKEAAAMVLGIYDGAKSIKDNGKEQVKAAVYDLDDLGGDVQLVLKGYKLLVKSSHWREKHFYKKEIDGIFDSLSLQRFFTENPDSVLMGGPEFRRDRSDKRPASFYSSEIQA
jgi:hypothetical protein